METLPWIAAVVAIALLAIVLLSWSWLSRRSSRAAPLPTEWALSARPVFSTDERRVYKLMREALPHHVILAKLPLVRFCQPNDPGEVRYWYELLGSINVTFAVCSANGRVLAAIDLDTDRSGSRRMLQIKQSVLGACRVRYLRCPIDNLPSAGELQLLVPSASAGTRGQNGGSPPTDLNEARDSLASTVASRRAQRSALWQDSSRFQDSFFAPDSRQDGFSVSEYPNLPPPALAAAAAARTGTHSQPGELNGLDRLGPGDEPEPGGAVVVDPEPASFSRSRH